MINGTRCVMVVPLNLRQAGQNTGPRCLSSAGTDNRAARPARRAAPATATATGVSTPGRTR